VGTDPAPFLSTIILASAGLVAIIGGLLVARFVGLDSDERTNRRVVMDAAARLGSARRRVREAHASLQYWQARDFLDAPKVVEAIGRGVSELDELRRFAKSPLSDSELQPFVSEVVDEFARVRRLFSGGQGSDVEVATLGRWPRVLLQVAEEAEEPSSDTYLEPVDRSQIEVRRYDEARAANERAQQRVEDYEDELRRLREAHAEIVRPDARLWWGVGILIAFAIVGVALPAWVMSQGPKDLATVQWLVYPFGGALAILLAYIVVYLAQLSRRKPPPLEIAGDAAVPPGA